MALVAALLPVVLSVAFGIPLVGAFMEPPLGKWVDHGAGCCTPPLTLNGSALYTNGIVWQGHLSECLEVCQAECVRLGELCGSVNHGWVQYGKKSDWCSLVSPKALAFIKSGPTDCGSCGDCGVHCYGYQPPPTPSPAGTWEDLGAGCCEPKSDAVSYLFHGPLSVDREVCEAMCLSFGALCGIISHGWEYPDGKKSSWCRVLPPTDQYERNAGPKDCGSCGDCGVHCYQYKPPLHHGTWYQEGAGCCVPPDPCHVLFQGPLSTDAQVCQAHCLSFGDLCGWVNHGWGWQHGGVSEWCTVISSEADYQKTHIPHSGRHDCGSRGDNGVNCWAFRPSVVPPPSSVTFGTFGATLP